MLILGGAKVLKCVLASFVVDVDEVINQLRSGCRLVVNRHGRHVYLELVCRVGGGRAYTSICDFAREPNLCDSIINSLIEAGAISRDLAIELRERAARLLGASAVKPAEAVNRVRAFTPPTDLINRLISARNGRGALRELRDLVTWIVESTSQSARRYHALGFLTERIILPKVGLSNDEVMELWRLSDEEYLTRMLKYLSDIASAYEQFNAEVQELREENELLKQEIAKKDVEIAYLETVLEDLRELANPLTGLREALLMAIAANAPAQVMNALLDKYVEALIANHVR